MPSSCSIRTAAGGSILGGAGVEQPGLGLVGEADIEIRRTLDEVDLQRQRVAGRESVTVNFREEVGGVPWMLNRSSPFTPIWGILDSSAQV